MSVLVHPPHTPLRSTVAFWVRDKLIYLPSCCLASPTEEHSFSLKKRGSSQSHLHTCIRMNGKVQKRKNVDWRFKERQRDTYLFSLQIASLASDFTVTPHDISCIYFMVNHTVSTMKLPHHTQINDNVMPKTATCCNLPDIQWTNI